MRRKDVSQALRFLSWGLNDQQAKAWKGRGNSRREGPKEGEHSAHSRSRGAVSVLGAEEARTKKADRRRSWAFSQNAMLNHQMVLSRADLPFKRSLRLLCGEECGV